MKIKHTKIKKTLLILQYKTLKSTVVQLASGGWHPVNRQEELLTGGGRGGERWESWRSVSNRRWRASCNFTHAWHWWQVHPFERSRLKVLFVGDLLPVENSNQVALRFTLFEAKIVQSHSLSCFTLFWTCIRTKQGLKEFLTWVELSCQLYPFTEEEAAAQWSQWRTQGLRVIQWQSQGLGLVHKLQPVCWPMDRVTHQSGFLGIGVFLECRCFSAKFSNVCILSHFSHIWLCDTMDCSPPGSSVLGIS